MAPLLEAEEKKRVREKVRDVNFELALAVDPTAALRRAL